MHELLFPFQIRFSSNYYHYKYCVKGAHGRWSKSPRSPRSRGPLVMMPGQQLPLPDSRSDTGGENTGTGREAHPPTDLGLSIGTVKVRNCHDLHLRVQHR